MTLFITTSKRQLEISDLYVMTLTFILFFTIGKITRNVFNKLIENKKQKNRGENYKTITLYNPNRGSLELILKDDMELAKTILTCIADNESYIIKSPELIRIIFTFVREKITNKSLVLTPNLLRFVALKLINDDQKMVTKVGNVILSSNNRVRLYNRIIGAAAIGTFGALIVITPYAVILALMYFDVTDKCVYSP